MAYALHIERLNPKGEAVPIPIEEWKEALSTVRGVRPCSEEAVTISNPATNAVLRIPHRDGDAEVYFPQERAWHAVFSWFRGSASFKAAAALDNLPGPVWTAAVALATHLAATVRGDDGELYDLETGEVVDG